MDFKVHLRKMDFKVHLGKMDFKVHFLKVGLFAPALVIDIVIPSFFPCPPVPPTHHNTFWLTLKVNSHRHQTNHTTYLRHMTTSHNKTCHYHCCRCLFRRCLHARQPPPQAPPPRRAPDDNTTIRDDRRPPPPSPRRRYNDEGLVYRAEVPDQAAARSRERQGAVFCRPGRRGRQRCGLGGPRPDVVLRRRVLRGFDAALVVGVVVAVGGRGEGGG